MNKVIFGFSILASIVLFVFSEYIRFAICNILPVDLKYLIWREKLILFIIWSFAIKFRLMTSVNWFSPDIAICFQKVICCCWDNLTYNSFSFLLKGTLLWYCFNINWGVVKHELSIIKHPYPIFRLSCTSEILLEVVQCAEHTLFWDFSPTYSFALFFLWSSARYLALRAVLWQPC